jgi:hypothetical protein
VIQETDTLVPFSWSADYCGIVACVGAAILVTLLVWGVKNPVVWRLLSVVAVGSGVGFLVWGITSAAMREEPSIGSPTALIGTGAGVMGGVIMLLVVSFFKRSPS